MQKVSYNRVIICAKMAESSIFKAREHEFAQTKLYKAKYSIVLSYKLKIAFQLSIFVRKAF